MSLASHADVFGPPAAARPDGRRPLIGLDRDALTALMGTLGEPAFRARQIWRWVYGRGVTDFEAMTDIARPLRARLADAFVIDRPTVASEQISRDGTRTWLAGLADGHKVETVHIP